MKTIGIIFLVISFTFIKAELNPEDIEYLSDSCCTDGLELAVRSEDRDVCNSPKPSDEEMEPEQHEFCVKNMKKCCVEHFKAKDECKAGLVFAKSQRCSGAKTKMGKTCCEECKLGRLEAESQGKDACAVTMEEYDSPTTTLKKTVYKQCCEEASIVPTTTTEKKVETTTEKKIETTTKKRASCKDKNPCEHVCSDSAGVVTCQCRSGFRLQADGKSCKDVNECAESLDDLCPVEGTVCHNTVGAFKCVPLKKKNDRRDTSRSCPPGFKRNIANQVCDDINECQLPRPPCPKYLCENTIGGYKCAGKPGKPVLEAQAPPEPAGVTNPKTTSDMCPTGFRDGPDNDCVDIDECGEHLDDCQRLSQHCINTHGTFFCQDHASKRCAPGLVYNKMTGICEDIDECVENPQVCRRSEVCVNLPGAYDCKSKISTLPKLNSKTCQEGTRMRDGRCEDIDECREGTHLCDPYQNCINTYGAHECRCKNGFEVNSTTGSCVDIQECTQNLHNCPPDQYCLNTVGSYTCVNHPVSTTHAPSDYEYYYSGEEEDEESVPAPSNPVAEHRPEPPSPRPYRPTRPTPPPSPRLTPPVLTPRPTTPTPTTQRPTTQRPTTQRPTTQRATTQRATTQRPTTQRATTQRPTTQRPTTPKPTTEKPTTPRATTTMLPRTTTEIPTTTSDRTPRVYQPRPTSPHAPAIPPATTRPYRPYTNRPQPTPREEIPPNFSEVYVPSPVNPNTIEKENKNGTYELNVDEIPKNNWTNIVPKDPDFEIDNLHCLNGYEKNALGECVDSDECSSGNHICSNLEECVNKPGGYICVCMTGYERGPKGWCVLASVVAATSSTTSSTTSTTTERVAEYSPRVPPPPPLPPRPEAYPSWSAPTTSCDFGYEYSRMYGRCVDIDECSTGRANCKLDEQCENYDGGYRCSCGPSCHRNEYEPPTYPSRIQPTTNTITVGSHYGQRGSRYVRPHYARLSNNGVRIDCPWGYKLTPNKQCLDIDECSTGTSECGPQQTCQNYHGGYACQCQHGYKLSGRSNCEDVDECSFGEVCSLQGRCINTPGSYRCECKEGFRNAAHNDKVCDDLDECSERDNICEHICINTYGGYRCACHRGFELGKDNRTCVDVDECALASARGGRLCAGECLNERGSYRCGCPSGYRSAVDGINCIDIDECETGAAHCAADPRAVCQNTRGGYHCHEIRCPSGYALEGKHVCKRTQRMCPISDMACIRQPTTYSYNFISFVSKIHLASDTVDIFTVHGPVIPEAIINFELQLIDIQAPQGVRKADLSCFHMRPSIRQCTIALGCSLEGPQVIEMDLTMSVFQRGNFVGSMVAKLIVIVSQYTF